MLDDVIQSIVDEIDNLVKDGRSYRWIAGKMGVSYTTVENLHKGATKNPEISTIIKYAKGLGLDMHRIAHHVFDLDPPEELMEMEGLLKEIYEMLQRVDRSAQAVIKSMLQFHLQQHPQGGDSQTEMPEAKSGYG